RIAAAMQSGRAIAPLWARPQGISGAIDGSFCDTTGKWVWHPGDIAAFVRSGLGGCAQALDTLINCGGSAAGSYAADKLYMGGTPVTTAEAVDLLHLTNSGLPIPPDAVYQAARNYSGAEPGEIVYTISHLQPGVPCRIRIHTCEIEAGFDRSQYMRLCDLTVAGLTTWTRAAWEPWREANYYLYTAPNDHLDMEIIPDGNGTITVTSRAARREVAVCAATNTDLATVGTIQGVEIEPGVAVALLGQTDPVQNGVWALNEAGVPQRVSWAASSLDVVGVVFYVLAGVYADRWYRNTNDDSFVLGTDAATFAEYSDLPYHATIT
ncbi:MAG: hypothetical protein WC718_19305, partial [Phycisphaerales bacterium]